MDCPVCKRATLVEQSLSLGLPAYRCTECQGIWLSAAQYWDWVKKREGAFSEPELTTESPTLVEEVGQAKICPGCGHILRRYKIWPEVPFYLDHCSNCGSMWFDHGEWEVLRERDLHDRVHLFFSDLWQEKLRAEEARRRMDRIYRQKFGEEDYARIREIRAWLQAHPQQGALLAFLTDPHPYSPLSEKS